MLSTVNTLDLAELFEVARSTVYRAIQRAGAPAEEQERPPPQAPDRAT
jgi:DNA invertase Pin-like site-specific DNA recombinase